MPQASRAAFQYPNFRFYIAARFLAASSSEMQAVAVAWQVYGITHRPLDLGLVGLAQFLPGVLLFLLAGHAADHFPRRNILQVCYAGFSLCPALLLYFTWHGGASVYPIYLVLLLNGTVRAFNGPASQAFLPILVPAEVFPNAVAWASSSFQAASILGPSIGGLLYGIYGRPTIVYACSAVAYLTAMILLSLLRLEKQPTPSAASPGVVLEGLRFIGRNKLILGAMSLDLVAVLLGGATAMLPVYAREILNVGATGLGVLRSAPGAGAVAMAVVLAHWPLRRREGAIMLWSVFGYGIAILIFAVSRNLVLSLIALGLSGAFDMVSVIVRHTMIQLGTPNAMRGRVSSVNMVFIGASNEVGQFESGLTAQWFGAVPAVILGGVGTIVVVLLWAGLFPPLRQASELTKRADPVLT